MRTMKSGIILAILAGFLGLVGCADRYDRAPQQPPTAKTYSVYKERQRSGGFKLTQIPGVIDMISGLMK